MTSAIRKTPAVGAEGVKRPARHALSLSVSLDTEDRVGNATLRDLSRDGLLIETEEPLSMGEQLSVELPHHGTACATIVWTSGNSFGCKFSKPISLAGISAARLKSSATMFSTPVGAASPEGAAHSTATAVETAARGGLGVAKRIQLIGLISLALWSAFGLTATLLLWG